MSNAFDPFQGWDDEEPSAPKNANEKVKADDWFSDTAWGAMEHSTLVDNEKEQNAEHQQGDVNVSHNTLDSNAALLAETSILSFDNSSVNWSFLQPGENSSANIPSEDKPSPRKSPNRGENPLNSGVGSSSSPDNRQPEAKNAPKSSSSKSLKPTSGELFPSDPMSLSRVEGHGPTVHVAIQEQLNCLFDDFSNGTSRRIEGTIHVRAGDELVNEPFLVHIRDPNKHVAQLLEEPTICQDITAQIIESENPGDRVLRVNLTPKHTGETSIASYVCDSELRPIPLLVKTKVRSYLDIQKVRVGIKIRSNPANVVPMTRLAVIMAVPPDVNGETVLMSKEGGVWDSMKRVIAWSLEPLEPGHVIEVQCQLDFMVPSQDKSRPTPRFPVLIRCDAVDEQFSSIELSGIHDPTRTTTAATEKSDEPKPPVKINVSKTTRILHRKV